MPRSLRRIPDYFTEEEAGALVNAAPSYPARMAFRIMLKTGLRVSEALALRRVDLRLDQHPPIIVVAADSPGNKGRKGRKAVTSSRASGTWRRPTARTITSQC